MYTVHTPSFLPLPLIWHFLSLTHTHCEWNFDLSGTAQQKLYRPFQDVAMHLWGSAVSLDSPFQPATRPSWFIYGLKPNFFAVVTLLYGTVLVQRFRLKSPPPSFAPPPPSCFKMLYKKGLWTNQIMRESNKLHEYFVATHFCNDETLKSKPHKIDENWYKKISSPNQLAELSGKAHNCVKFYESWWFQNWIMKCSQHIFFCGHFFLIIDNEELQATTCTW